MMMVSVPSLEPRHSQQLHTMLVCSLSVPGLQEEVKGAMSSSVDILSLPEPHCSHLIKTVTFVPTSKIL